MKTQLEISNDLAKNSKCPQCNSALTLVQQGQHQWAIECMSNDDGDNGCGYMIVKDTMQEAYLAWVAEGNTPEPADEVTG